MPKACVFCGNAVTDKTMEHVIPDWLIEMTDSGHDVVRFAPVPGNGPVRWMPWKALHFPACADCNARYRPFEGKTKSILTALLGGRPVSGREVSHLLDWFDKVRIGLWLGMQYLQQNPAGIVPNFHIDRRLGKTDRAVAIYNSTSPSTRLQAGGVQGPSFQFSPVAFWMRIEHLVFLNVASPGLCAPRMGLPVLENPRWTDIAKSQFRATLIPGTGTLNGPILPRDSDAGSVLSQAATMFGADGDVYYDNDHCRAMLDGMPRGMSKICVDFGSSTTILPPDAGTQICLHADTRESELMPRVSRAAYEAQMDRLENAASRSSLPDHEREAYEASIAEAREHVGWLEAAAQEMAKDGWTLWF